MVETLVSDTSELALMVLLAEKSGSNPSEVEAANRTIHIHSIAQKLKAHKLGAAFERLVSDAVNGLAFALLCTPRPDQNLMISLLDTLRSIERFSEKRLSQLRLYRLWRRRSDQRKVVEYQYVLQKQLAMFGLQDGMSIRDNFDRVQMAQGQPRHPVRTTSDGRLGPGENSSTTSGSGSDHATISDHIPLPDQFPSQRTGPAFPHRTTQRRSDSHTPVATSPLSSPPDPSSVPQTPFPTFLGSQVTIFVIDQLIANFPSFIENHDSGNVTTTTVTGSANDSSIRSI